MNKKIITIVDEDKIYLYKYNIEDNIIKLQ